MSDANAVCKHFVCHRLVCARCRRLVTKDGYCALHHPDAKARRAARRQQRYEEANIKIREQIRERQIEEVKLRRIRRSGVAMVKLLRRIVRDYNGKRRPAPPRKVFFDDVRELLKEIDGE